MVTVTVKDIARETGYSVPTVTAVLRNKARELQIKPSTEKLILETAEKLGYVKSDLALEMRTGQSKTIVILRPHATHEFIFTVTEQSEIIASQHGYHIRTVINTASSGSDDFAGILRKIVSMRPAAIITCTDFGSDKPMLAEWVRKHKLPWLGLDYYEPDADITAVTDDRTGIDLSIEYLHSLGHTRIIHATDTLKAQYADIRYRAFLDSMRSRGLDVDESLCFHDYFLDASNLKQFVERIAAMKNPPTAISCGSDYMAVKLLMLLPYCGLRVPKDISLIAYGGLAFRNLCVPALTAVYQPFDQLVDQAIRELLKMIRKEPYQN